MMKKFISTVSAVLVASMLAATLSGCGAKSADEATAAGDMIYNQNSGSTVDPSGDDGVSSEDYGKLIENEFVNVSDEATSTFSADVDTASYSFFRKLVNSGYSLENLVANGSAFRTEEFINYFSYQASLPSDDELFGLTTDIIACPWNAECSLLRLTLTANDAVEPVGNNLVFLIDVSGSMSSDDKLPLLKESFSYLVAQLGENDRVSIVTYSGSEAVVLEGCRGDQGERIMEAINSLDASGSTNGESGLKKAYQIAEANYIAGGNNRIIMASDGDLNVGISSADELKAFVEGKRDQGVYLSVLGFGTGNYRDANMETLADNGNGVYYYIDGETEAEKIFGTDLVSTLYTVAEDVKLQITFEGDYVEAYRLVGYENRLLNYEDFTDDTKDAGDVGAGHQVTVFYELKLKDNADSAEKLMELAVRYKNPGEVMSREDKYVIGSSSFTQADDDLKFMCSVIELTMILHRSKFIGDITLDDVKELLGSIDLSDDALKEEFCGLINSL